MAALTVQQPLVLAPGGARRCASGCSWCTPRCSRRCTRCSWWTSSLRGAWSSCCTSSSSLPTGIPGSAAAAEAQVVDPTIGDEPEGIAPDAFEAGKNPEALAAAAANCDAKPKEEEDIEGPACKKEAVARSVPFSEPTKEEEADPEAKADTVPDTRLDNLPPGTCSWQGCCTKDKPPLPAELGLMRPHKHKPNPKMVNDL